MIRPEDYLSEAEMQAIGYVPQKRALEGKRQTAKRLPDCKPEIIETVVYFDFSSRRRDTHNG